MEHSLMPTLRARCWASCQFLTATRIPKEFSVLSEKNRTETRASMGVSTLEALLVNKLGGRVQLSDSVLQKCKRATMESLKS